MEDEWEEGCPCKECEKQGHYCDYYDAQYCCKLCHYVCGDDPDCENCDPMDI